MECINVDLQSVRAVQAQPELFVRLTSGNVRNVVIKRKEMADGSTPGE